MTFSLQSKCGRYLQPVLQGHRTVMPIYQLLEKLGEGSFGVVYKAIDLNTNNVLAVKKMKYPVNGRQREKFNTEIELLERTGSHDNIVQIIDSFTDSCDASVCIIMEFCEFGDLNRYVTTTHVSVDLKVDFMGDMSNGLHFLHQNDIVHRDMKPANVLVTQSGRPVCKISDFGEARMHAFAGQLFQMAPYPLDSYLTSIHGTMAYIAPEVLGNHYTSSCDVFSLGVIFYALFSMYVDCTEMTNILNPYVDGQCMYQVPFAQITNAVERLQTLPTPLRKLILNMLKTDYHQRITIREVKETLMTYIMCRQQELRSQALLTQGTLHT